jgi:hypothetical protein
LNDQFQEHIEKLGALEPLDFLKIEQQLKDFNQGVEKHIKEIVAIALETANENDLTVDDFPFKKLVRLGILFNWQTVMMFSKNLVQDF